MRAYRPQRPATVGEEVLMAGRIRGLRSWQPVPGPEGEWRLAALNGELWERGRPTRAVCRHGRAAHRGHAPADGCTCGLHAVHPWASNHLDWMDATMSVVGIVRAWGCVHLHREGFRAQWAEPAVLFLIGLSRRSEFGRLLVDLAQAHGAELWEAGDLEAALRRCERERIGLAQRTVATLLEPAVSDLDQTG